MHPSTSPSVEEQAAAVYWIAELLAKNEIDVIVCCMSPYRLQRSAMRHSFYDQGIAFHEVWVDSDDDTEELERSLHYEHPCPPCSRAVVTGYGEWDVLARRVLFELEL